ncbi:hypothetical protein [Vibrio rumoiensis]|uniref:hypothetical protein n=1 Tax=Vibrio rumoiensis TaxID=76258 RepID=UPI0018E99C5D|nr:hypothetical protein [Vibrio rumoiensis]
MTKILLRHVHHVATDIQSSDLLLLKAALPDLYCCDSFYPVLKISAISVIPTGQYKTIPFDVMLNKHTQVTSIWQKMEIKAINTV